jgi:mannose-6-phosphate isomerase-like protein (cupin superfamily)
VIANEIAPAEPNDTVTQRLVTLLGHADVKRRDIDPAHEIVAWWARLEQPVADHRHRVEQRRPAEIEEVGAIEPDLEHPFTDELEVERRALQPVPQLVDKAELRTRSNEIRLRLFNVRDLHALPTVTEPRQSDRHSEHATGPVADTADSGIIGATASSPNMEVRVSGGRGCSPLSGWWWRSAVVAACGAVRGGEWAHRIAAVPFTLRNLKEDLDDVGSNFDGAPDLEFRLATKALELEQSGLCYQRVPPGYRFPYGPTHKEQEEVYVVVRGSGRMKLDDEIVEVKEWDVVRVPPGTWRGYESGSQGLEILVFGAPNLGENPRDDVEGQRDWWDE